MVVKICKHHSDVMVSSAEGTKYFIDIVIKSMQDKPNISVLLCQAIEELAKSVEPIDEQ